MDLLTLAQALASLRSDVLVLSDVDGVVWFAGPRVEQTLGCPIEHAIRRRLWEVLVAVGPAGEVVTDVQDAFIRAMRHGDEADASHWSPQWVTLRGRDGHAMPGWLTVLPLGRKAENALAVFRVVESGEKGSALWRSVLDTIDEPVIALDRRLRIWEMNTAARALLEDPQADPHGMPCWKALHGDADFPPECPVPDAFRTRKTTYRTVVELGPGRTFEVTCWPLLDGDGRPALALERLRPI